MKFPNTVDRNTYKAFITPPARTAAEPKPINALDLAWDSNAPEPLRVLCIRSIANDWQRRPVFREIPLPSDRNSLLDILDVQLPLDALSTHIRDDVFWRRCFRARWHNFYPHSMEPRPWISLYMERYLAEHLESLKPADWDEERMQQMLRVCGPNVHSLRVGQLQPAMDEENDHIRMDVVLGGLPEVRRLDISYALKSIGTEFFLGCSNMSVRDAKWLTLGIETCGDLVEFRFHSTKLDPANLRSMAAALSRHCPKLELISLCHCNISDLGLVAFLRELSAESLSELKHVQLGDNKITKLGAMHLSEVICQRPIESLSLRLNAIGSSGAAAVLLAVSRMPIQSLDISGCAIDGHIGDLLCSVLNETQTLKDMNLSANDLGQDLGSRISATDFARQLHELDLRNTGIGAEDRCQIDAAILENRMKS